MPSYLELPEALDFVAGQAWLSPAEAVRAAKVSPTPPSVAPPLKWRDALREIAAVVGRIRLA